MTALEIYNGSDGDATKAYYAELGKCGPVGEIAVCLFRAQKCSARAKLYRGGLRGHGSFKGMAYERKQWSLSVLAGKLLQYSGQLGITWGWKADPVAEFGPSWVIYVELPTGQVSFHSPARGIGPDFPGEWDREHKSAERILAFCDRVLNAPDPRQEQLAL